MNSNRQRQYSGWLLRWNDVRVANRTDCDDLKSIMAEKFVGFVDYRQESALPVILKMAFAVSVRLNPIDSCRAVQPKKFFETKSPGNFYSIEHDRLILMANRVKKLVIMDKGDVWRLEFRFLSQLAQPTLHGEEPDGSDFEGRRINWRKGFLNVSKVRVGGWFDW